MLGWVSGSTIDVKLCDLPGESDYFDNKQKYINHNVESES